jgi:4-hydroxybenzoyl-CoA thioesterase
MAFKIKLPIRFGDIDHAGLLYYPRFFQYFHEAFEEFFAQSDGEAYHEVLDDRKIGFPIVNIEANFHAPFRYGDLMRVELAMKRVGTTSITFSFNAYRNDEDVLCAEALITKAVVNMSDFKPTGIPDDLRARFQTILENGG